MLADLTEAYDKCANWYLKDTAASFNFEHFEPYTIDGKLYGIPTGRYGYEHNMYWVRGDILDELGMKPEDIRTLEDIENLLVTFKEKYPELSGPSDQLRCIFFCRSYRNAVWCSTPSVGMG